jgi:hypothetical protein
MKFRSVIAVFVAVALVSSQLTLAIAHGAISHDHGDTALAMAPSSSTTHHAGSKPHDVAKSASHSHVQIQFDAERAVEALQACAASCSAVLASGGIFLSNGTLQPGNLYMTGIKPAFVELATPPPILQL